MQGEQRVQDDQYAFPYHYIPRWEGGFSQAVVLRWGYEYAAYTSHLLERLARLEFDSLLDVGCGDGRFVSEAQRRFGRARSFVGVDYSERAIQLAQAMNPVGSFVCASVVEDDLPGQPFDVVTLIETLEHIPPEDVAAFVEGLRKQTRDGAVLLVSVPSDNIPVQKKHYQHFDLASLTAALSPHFRIRDHAFINRRSPWVKLLERCMANGLYALREHHLLSLGYRAYVRYGFHADASNAKRVVAECVAS
jgi:SAM-dependent methyltransferase